MNHSDPRIRNMFVTKAERQTAQCGSCQGSGKGLVMGEEKCCRCMGTGRDTQTEFWAGYCSKCGGNGRTSYCRREGTCTACNGSGRLHY